jgi:hypothetical protein
MRKLMGTVMVLGFILACGSGAFAQETPVAPGKHLSQDQIQHLETKRQQRHQKKAHHSRKVAGQARNDAHQVSPAPVKKNPAP